MRNKRRYISEVTISEVLVECRRYCCLCFYFDGIIDRCDGQIAHIDRDPANASKENLVWLCLKHHEEYDRMPSTAKRLTQGEILAAQTALYERLILFHPEPDCVEDGESVVFFEVTIPGDLNEFTEGEQAEILQALGKLARIRGGVQLMYKRRGSIKIGIGVTEEEAGRLLKAFEAGEFKALGVSEVYLQRVTRSRLLDKVQEHPTVERDPHIRNDEEQEVREDFSRARAVGGTIRGCLAMLSTSQRAAVTLCLQGHSISDMAHLLGWSTPKVRNLLYKGMSSLRICLEKKGIQR